MKKIILLLVVATIFSCKKEFKKTEVKQAANEVKQEQFEVIKSFTAQDVITWTKTRVNLDQTTEVEYSDVVYKIERTTKDESSFLSTSLIPVTYGNICKASVIVKKGSDSSFFGFRISGSYPDRADAVFDLETGGLKAVKKARDFENESASIEPLGDGWYKCTVTTEVAADNIRIMLGPTTNEKDILGWEGKTGTTGNIYFAPSSLVVEEVKQQ